MTIRRRFTIALAVAGGVLILCLMFARWTVQQACTEIDGVRESHLVALQEAKQVSRGVSAISVGLAQLASAARIDNVDKIERANDNVSAGFEKTYESLESVRKAIVIATSSERKAPEASAYIDELVKLEREIQSLESAWQFAQAATSPREMINAAMAAGNEASTTVDRSLKLQNVLILELQRDLGDVSFSMKRVSTIVALASSLIIAFSVGASLLVSRWFAKRLDDLRVCSQRIAGGSIDVRAEAHANDEFGDVARAFNEMVDTLQETQTQLEFDALHDGLTGLPNRTLFLDRVTRRLYQAQRNADHDYALIFLDLDHFKRVNDALGHAAGDELLKTISGRLVGLMREFDREQSAHNTVSRLGGDEFTILIERFAGVDRDRFTQETAAKIQSVISSPIVLGGQAMQISTSLGIILGSPDRTNAASLLRDADAALYRAKADGRGRFAIFDMKMHESIARRLQQEHDLRFALERGELLLYYQPISDLRSIAAGGFEALLRWKRNGQIVNPDQFIPIAEETGMIVKIGEWVISEGCRQLKEWQTTTGQPITLSLNVSPRQLSDRGLVLHLKKVLAESGVAPESIIVEITETAIVERGPSCEALVAIRALGVRVYMDDFGTGYSTLGSLNDYPVDGIKLDRSFIKKNEGREDQLAVLEAVVQLAHQLDLPVVAEGVETHVQLAMLENLGCDKVQGFYFARPMPAEQALAYLLEKRGPQQLAA